MPENKNLMDTEPGGEQTQYEGQNTFMQGHSKEEGQFKDTTSSSAPSQKEQFEAARGEQKAENIRYGQAMSEQGMGGQTVGMEGKTTQGGFGEIEDQSLEGQKTRREQGYGGGSGVGG